MRVHVLYAHPLPDSLSSRLHQVVLDSLRERGADVDDLDLYADEFDPLLRSRDRQIYHDTRINQERVSAYVSRLQAADALVLCHPVWNFGWPAILKGYFDRMFLPNVSFRIKDGEVLPGLTNIRTLVTVTTYGATRLRALYLGDPPRMNATRFLRVICAPDVRVQYLALYGINKVSGPKVDAFVDKVRRTIHTLC